MKPYEMNAQEDLRTNRNGGGPVRDSYNRRERYSDARPPYNKKIRNSKRRNEYEEDNNKRGYDDYPQKSSIEARVARERPCRTLFVRNIQYNIPEKEIRSLFEKFGEVKDVFNLIDKRGMVFITFYDVRCSENAKNEMQYTTLYDRKIDVHYSLPKEEEEKAKCDRTKNQGTLLYTLKNSSVHLDDDKLHEYLSQFGQVKDIRIPNFKKAHLAQNYDRNQRLVEFYDSRACVAAFDGTIEKEYGGGWWDVAFFWDHPYKERVNAGKRERVDRREREKTRVPASTSRGDSPSRYEQAQKAQQMLSALSGQQSAYSPASNFQSLPQQSYRDKVQQPYMDNQIRQSYTDNQQPYMDNQVQQPYMENQVQQLLGLLTQAAQQHHQQSQQHQPVMAQYMQPPVYSQPSALPAPIPSMDPLTALTQLAALLQKPPNP